MIRLGPELCDISTYELQERSILSQSTIHVYPLRYPQNISGLSFADAEDVRPRACDVAILRGAVSQAHRVPLFGGSVGSTPTRRSLSR